MLVDRLPTRGPPLPNSPGDHFLMADSSRWYTVTVSDGIAPAGTDSVFVFVIDTFSMPQISPLRYVRLTQIPF